MGRLGDQQNWQEDGEPTHAPRQRVCAAAGAGETAELNTHGLVSDPSEAIVAALVTVSRRVPSPERAFGRAGTGGANTIVAGRRPATHRVDWDRCG
jgi:hypothetical protein